MTTPAPPRKHLYTLPVVTVLPDPTTVPEGYPVLLEVGVGAAAKRTLYQRQGTTFVKAGGGGGGSVKYGELLPATGAPIATAVPGADTQNILGSNGGVFTFANSELTQSGSTNGLDAAGNPITQAWAFRSSSPGDVQDYAFDVRLPYRNSPGGSDPDPGGQRALRMDFRFRAPRQGRGYYVVMVAESYDPAYTSRVIPYWSVVDYHDSVELPSNQSANRYYAEQDDDPADYAPEWGYQGNNGRGWQDVSVTIPPGARGVQFYTYIGTSYQADGYQDPKTGDFDAAITDIRFTECDHDGVEPGSMFIETSVGAVWLYDDTIVYKNASDREKALGLAPGGTAGSPDTTFNGGYGGAGWYRIVRPQLQLNYGMELDNTGEESYTYHLGYHYFGYLTDLDGNTFAPNRYGKYKELFKGRLPAASELTYYEDRFLVQDGPVPTPPYQLDRPSHLPPPVVQGVNLYYGTGVRSIANGATRWYKCAARQPGRFGQVNEGVPTAAYVATNNSGAPRSFSINIVPPATATAVAIYASDTGPDANDYVKLGEAPVTDPGNTVTFVDYLAPQGNAIATPTTATDQTFGAGIVACGFMDLNATAFGASSILTVDSGTPDTDFLVEAVYFNNSEFIFRYEGVDDYFSVRAHANDPTTLDIINRLAGVETVLASFSVPQVLIGGLLDYGSGNAPLGYRVHASGIHLTVTALSHYPGFGTDTAVYDADILTTDHAAATKYGWQTALPYTKLTRLYCATRGPVAPSEGYPFRLAFNGAAGDSVIAPLGDNPRFGAFSFSLSRRVVAGFYVPFHLIRRRSGAGIYTDRTVIKQASSVGFYSNPGTLGQSANLYSGGQQTPLSGYQDTIEGWFTVPAPVSNAYQEPTPVELTGSISFGGQ